MTWSRVLAVSGLAVMLGAQARAESAGKGPGKIEDPARVGKAGGTSDGTKAVGTTPAGARELSGTIVRADAKTVYLEHMGAVVAMRVDGNTRFSGEGVKSSRDLKEGQQVRASFTVKETTNVADRIIVGSASGRPPAEMGRGTPPGHPEGMPPGHPPVPPERDPTFPPDRSPVPRDPGTPPPVDPGGPSVPKY